MFVQKGNKLPDFGDDDFGDCGDVDEFNESLLLGIDIDKEIKSKCLPNIMSPIDNEIGFKTGREKSIKISPEKKKKKNF